MKNQNIVSQIVCGSKNINRMREEIHLVVASLIGLARKAACIKRGDRLDLPTNNGVWIIEKSSHEGPVDVVYFKKGHDHMYVSNAGVRSIDYEDAEQVYEGLHIFVEGMFEKYPDIKAACEPMLKAAARFQ